MKKSVLFEVLSKNPNFSFWLEFIQLCFKKWLVILIFGISFGLLGFGLSFLSKPDYVSRLTFTIDAPSMSSIGGLSGIASSMGLGSIGASTSVFEGENMIELLKSKSLIEESLLKTIPNKKITFVQKYIDDYELNEQYVTKEHLKSLKFPINLDRDKLTYHQDSILKDIYMRIVDENITIKTISSKVTIIEAVTKSKSPVFSRYFIEELLKVASDFYIETKTKKAKINYNVLKMQADSVRNELNRGLVGVASSNDNTFGLNPALMVKKVSGTKKQIDVQMNSVILAELVKNAELARVSLLNETPLIQVLDKPRYPLDEKKFRKLYGLIIGGFLGGILILGILFLNFKLLKNFNETEVEK